MGSHLTRNQSGSEIAPVPSRISQPEPRRWRKHTETIWFAQLVPLLCPDWFPIELVPSPNSCRRAARRSSAEQTQQFYDFSWRKVEFNLIQQRLNLTFFSLPFSFKKKKNAVALIHRGSFAVGDADWDVKIAGNVSYWF